MGKGSRRRPGDAKKYAEGYESAFGPRCSVHGMYRGEEPPVSECDECWVMYNEKHKGENK
jgi:hypothetical protein